MTTQPTTGVLIHGLHLQADNWEHMVWGDPAKGVWGTIPRGVEAAWKLQAQRIVWGTGASEKDGVKESEYTYQCALKHVDDLAQICGCAAGELKQFLEERSYLDTTTQSTREEVPAFLDRCMKEEITDVALVAVASHAPRSIRTVLALLTGNEKYAAFRHTISMLPSSSLFEGTTMEDVVIFEKPHRGDRPKNNNHLLARRTLNVLKTQKRVEFLADWEALIKKFES